MNETPLEKATREMEEARARCYARIARADRIQRYMWRALALTVLLFVVATVLSAVRP